MSLQLENEGPWDLSGSWKATACPTLSFSLLTFGCGQETVIQQQKGRLRFLGLKAGSEARVASLFQFLNKTSSFGEDFKVCGAWLEAGWGWHSTAGLLE